MVTFNNWVKIRQRYARAQGGFFHYGNSSVFTNLSIVPSFSNIIIHKQSIIPQNIQRIANGIDKINPIKSLNPFILSLFNYYEVIKDYL